MWEQPGKEREEHPKNWVGREEAAYGEVSLYCYLEDKY